MNKLMPKVSADYSDLSRDYQRIANAIVYLSEHRAEQPSLAELANHIGLSEHHLQRLFSEWAGVSPKRFLQFLTKEYAKQALHDSSVLESALAAGLSGSGRLHDLMVSWEGVTPGEYKAEGKGLLIRYGYHPCPFGWCLLAETERGICKLAFADDPADKSVLISELLEEWPEAKLQENKEATAETLQKVFPLNGVERKPLHLLLKGTEFQLKVWEALLAVSEGQLVTYSQLAGVAGCPKAVRAVSSAVARNTIAYLIPCHRVIRQSGETNLYRWGSTRKRAMIAREAGEFTN